MTILLYDLCGRDRSLRFSPHCWKTRLSLAHKRLDFTTQPVEFTQIPTIEGGATSIVPLIRDGEKLVSDSFAIAEYLESTYPDRPSLFAGEGGRALSRFVETWAMKEIHSALVPLVIMDVHDRLSEADRDYFRASREKALGRKLEEVAAGREAAVEPFLKALRPLRDLLGRQPFLGGEAPLFADYIASGPIHWLQSVATIDVLPSDDPVSSWYQRCLDLHDGAGRRVFAW